MFYQKGQNYGENKFKGMGCSIHAEEDVIRKMERKYSDKANKKNKKKFNLLVLKVSKKGDKIGMSRLCEKCVLRVYNLSNSSGIQVKNIFYSDENGEIVKTTPAKLYNRKDHHVTGYYKNRGYKPILTCLPCSDTESDTDSDISK